jgi:hypothetical protein
MERLASNGSPRFRLWVATYADGRPRHWYELPGAAIAVEPVDDALYSAAEAALFLEGFNSAVLDDPRSIWAVAVPVEVRFEGDARPGLPVRGTAFSPATPSEDETLINTPVAGSVAVDTGSAAAGTRDQFQGFDQSPQRAR